MSGPVQTLMLRNDAAELDRLAAFIDGFCEPLGATPKDTHALHLSLEEIVLNVINHGYRDGQPHEFSVALSAEAGRRVCAVITDDAAAYDPLARPEVDTSTPLEEREIGGLGVHLMKKLMDRVHYERRDGKNILTLERVLGAAR